MTNLRMIEIRGGGIKKMYNIQRKRFFPMPDYDLSANTVKVKIFGKILDENYTKLLIRLTDLNLKTVILLDFIQKKRADLVSSKQAKVLRNERLIEGRKLNYYVSAKIANITDEKAKYIKNQAFDKEYYMDMIEKLLIKYKSATRKEIDDLILDKLPEYMNTKQKKSKVHNIMSEMAKIGKIKNIGSKFKSKWIKL